MSIREVNQIAHSETEKFAIAQYYNQFINEDEEMPEGAPQFNLIKHLVDLLRWHFRDRNWYIIGNLPLYQPLYNPVGPDVAVFKGMVEPTAVLDELASWQMTEPDRPAPSVVFEVASGSTWRTDLEYKVGRYGQLGVHEYFAYDPNRTQLWTGVRLRGWRYNFEGQPQVINTNGQGWLWSKQLRLWLADARPKVRLYRSNGEQVLERAEEEYLARIAAEQREATERATRLLAEQQVRLYRSNGEQVLERAEEEYLARIAAEQREATERTTRLLAEQREATERAALQKLLAKLKASGIDPDKL